MDTGEASIFACGTFYAQIGEEGSLASVSCEDFTSPHWHACVSSAFMESTSLKNVPEHGTGTAIRKAFITGLLLCLPITLTIYVVVWLTNLMAAPARGFLKILLDALEIETHNNPIFNAAVTLVSAIIVIIFITLVGFVSRNLFGKYFIDVLERILRRVPMVRSVYAAIKQIIDTFSVSQKNTFSQVALVEFPRKGCWTLGFVTYAETTALCELTGTPLTHVFVPTTPNPTGGYMIFVPSSEITILNISVADAMKMIVAGGAVVPEHLKNARIEQ